MFRADVTFPVRDRIEAASNLLTSLGYDYDEHYEYLYGGGWDQIGIRFYNQKAALAIIAAYCGE